MKSKSPKQRNKKINVAKSWKEWWEGNTTLTMEVLLKQFHFGSGGVYSWNEYSDLCEKYEQDSYDWEDPKWKEHFIGLYKIINGQAP